MCGMWGWLPGGMAVRGAASGATTVSSAPTAASHMVATLAFPFSTAIFLSITGDIRRATSPDSHKCRSRQVPGQSD